MTDARPLVCILPGSLVLNPPEARDDGETRLELNGALRLEPGWRYENARVQISVWDAEGAVLVCDTGGVDLEYASEEEAPLPFQLNARLPTAALLRAERLRLVAWVEATRAWGPVGFPVGEERGAALIGQRAPPRRLELGPVLLGLSRVADGTDMTYEVLGRVHLGRPWSRLRVDLQLLDGDGTPVYADDSTDDATGEADPRVCRLRYYVKLGLHALASQGELRARIEAREASAPLDLQLEALLEPR